jgi:CubicO group peptidase (beta-lactamase class C family)
MPTLSKTRWLMVLWLLALISPTTYGQFLAQPSAREARLSSSALRQIDALLQQAVERKQIAGAVALLAHNGKLGYLRAKGFQDVEAGKEMASD